MPVTLASLECRRITHHRLGYRVRSLNPASLVLVTSFLLLPLLLLLLDKRSLLLPHNRSRLWLLQSKSLLRRLQLLSVRLAPLLLVLLSLQTNHFYVARLLRTRLRRAGLGHGQLSHGEYGHSNYERHETRLTHSLGSSRIKLRTSSLVAAVCLVKRHSSLVTSSPLLR